MAQLRIFATKFSNCLTLRGAGVNWAVGNLANQSRVKGRSMNGRLILVFVLSLASGFTSFAQPVSAAIVVGPGVQVGTVSGLTEVSGIAVSRSLPGTVWAHQDSGDTARFYGMSTSGVVHSTITLSGRTAVDWEDMAIGPNPNGGNYIYIGDIGDNGANRNSGVDIIRLSEPTSLGDATLTSAQYLAKRVTYPGIIFLREEDAESLFIDPLSSDLYIIQKVGQGNLFRMPANQWSVSGTYSMQSQGSINTEANYRPTSADISPDGKHILVRNSSNGGTKGFLFLRDIANNQSIQSAMQSTPIQITLQQEPQGEAIAWAPDGTGFYSISEGSNRQVYYYSFSAVPEPSSAALLLTSVGLSLSRRRRKSLR